MKTFSEIFLSILPSKLRDTLLAVLLGRVGDSLEVGISSKIETELLKKTDITYLDRGSVLNYLAFLGINVPSITPSSVNMSVTNNGKEDIVINTGDEYFDTTGSGYTVQASVLIPKGATRIVYMRQSIVKQYSLIYNNSIQTSIRGLISDSVKIYIRGQELQPTNSFDNGYVLYVTEQDLYLKIYAGIDTPNPQGAEVLITYNVSGGFLSTNPIFRTDVFGVGTSCYIDSFVNGAGFPSTENLQAILKTNIISNNKLVRRSDYTNFIQQDSRIAECFVIGDYERRVFTGVNVPSGVVEIYAIGVDLEPIPSVLQEELTIKMQDIKDISVTKFLDSEPYRIRQYLFYDSVLGSDSEFTEFAEIELLKMFDYKYLRTSKDSLFGDLDISESIKRIQSSVYNPRYLALRFAYEQRVSLQQGQVSRLPLFQVTTLERGAVAFWREEPAGLLLYAIAKFPPIDLGVYEIVRVTDDVVIGTVDYINAYAEISNIEGEDIGLIMVSSIMGYSKVSPPSLSSYRISAGIGFYKGVDPIDIHTKEFV